MYFDVLLLFIDFLGNVYICQLQSSILVITVDCNWSFHTQKIYNVTEKMYDGIGDKNSNSKSDS